MDDDPSFGPALRRTLNRTVDATLVGSLASAREVLFDRRWAGVLLDVGLPDGSGIEFLPELRAVLPAVPVLVMTGSFDTSLTNRAQFLGAEFAFKPDVLPNVSAFVERVIRGREDHRPRVLGGVDDVATEFQLPPRQREIVEHLSLGTPRDALASTMGISENTVKTHLRRAMVKMDVPDTRALRQLVLSKATRHAPPRRSSR